MKITLTLYTIEKLHNAFKAPDEQSEWFTLRVTNMQKQGQCEASKHEILSLQVFYRVDTTHMLKSCSAASAPVFAMDRIPIAAEKA